MNRILFSTFLFVFGSFGLHAVPAILNYAGQVAVNGQPFDGQGLFKFALVNADGNATYWSNDGTSANGSEPAAHVGIAVNGGLYSLLLGNTAMSGMGAIDPQVFAQHTDAKLRVWFSDGVNGFQQLSPDRPFASVPYAFSAGTAQSTTIADGSINKSMLGSDVIADLNKTVTITRDMLPQDVRDDLNATIGMDRLSEEVITKLDQNASGASGIVAGSLISVPYGQAAPAGYSLYQLGEPKELVWEEKAPVSIARNAYDGVEILDGKIYFAGGFDGSAAKNTFERYDPFLDTWTSLQSLSTSISHLSSSELNDRLYVIGGKSTNNLNFVNYYNPSTNSWSESQSLPQNIRASCAITYLDSIYLIGGFTNGQLSKVLEYNLDSNLWTEKANLNEARDLHKLVLFEGRIWAIGGMASGEIAKTVESYDPSSDSWQVESPLETKRNDPIAWVANGKIYVAGGKNDTVFYSSIEVYDPVSKSWSNFGHLPQANAHGDAVVLNDQVYVIAGATGSSVFSNKVFAADLNASVEGVYDLYRKDGNASAGTPLVQAEVADGSVTASKMADGAITPSKIATNSITTSQLNEQILKYLKPEITAQPQAQTVFADSNVSYSVSAEGKYLTYQWKKDGSDLTGENNSTMTITETNASLHNGNYSVVVSNDFGSVESGLVEVAITNVYLKVGLLGWWPFDGNASDMSGNENHGIVTGASLSNDKKGLAAKAYEFDGIGDYIVLPNLFYGNENFSLVYQTKVISSAKNYNVQISIGGVGTETILEIGYSSSLAFSFRSPNDIGEDFSISSGANSLPIEQWKHISWVFKPNEAQVYIDGNLVNSIQTVPSNLAYLNNSFSGHKLILGGKWKNGVYPNGNIEWEMNGLYDDVRIYDRALSAAEVQALYNMGQ